MDILPLVTRTTLDQALGEMVEDAPESSSFLLLEIARANFGYKIGACCTEAGFGSSSSRLEHLPGEPREVTPARHRACNLHANGLMQQSCKTEIKHTFFFFSLLQREESSLDSAPAVNWV